MIVAQCPGQEEAKRGAVLIGPTGKELEKLLSSVGISMGNECYLCNVCNCWPGPGNPDPKPEEIEACSYWLDGAIAIIEPRVIVALGNIAINHFLPGARVGEVHGRPVDMGEYILYPTYHPAAALHNPARMQQLLDDFARLPGILAGSYTPEVEVQDEYPEPSYTLLEHDVVAKMHSKYYNRPSDRLIAVDTETNRRGDLWCWSFSHHPGIAYVVMAEDLPYFRAMFQPPYTLIMHNATFDIGVIERAGIHITAPVEDTLLMS
ncbi:MAG: uracil-DNA glycosylase family protein, partial [Dehalococcoidia bacterium]|nr:uracil-DNA glycosylase family protein [Dehalococcoidia bacterium]